MAWTSNDIVIALCDLYCCLLPQCEALRTCRPGFPIAKKWCCHQGDRSGLVQPSQKERAIGADHRKKGGYCCNLSVGVALNV